ncbi:MAG: CCA tRNA nucleotidyltransferase [Ruminococcaceae bacterium]|jgi:tRNA nucleotidyltransferase (CCA-adding enzyme)|nr:CCA tRNA nucleotidyltransferase [Oscillospiraceae bacterium]
MLPRQALDILHRLNENGYEAYAVGGCVRDQLLGREPEDWDMTTSARPEQVMALFAGHCIPTGLQHGTVTVRQEHRSFEVTTFRTDGVYSDHRHPDAVAFSNSLEEDLRRRDFTIGAMAMGADGRIVDLFGGQEDLRNGVIRCVGDAERRFDEDALRIMRALRFAAVLGFSVAPDTADAIRKKAEDLRKIAVERIRVEMDKLLCGAHAAEVLLAFPDVIAVFLPEMRDAVGFQQKNPHHCYDVWEHTVRAAAAAPAEPMLRWTLLFHDLGKPKCFTQDEAGVGHFYGHGRVSCRLAAEATTRLKFDNASRERIELLVTWHDRYIPLTHRSFRRALNALGEEALRQLLAVKRADNMAQAPAYRSRLEKLDQAERLLDELLAADACFSLKQLAVNGRDIMALGLRGQAVGRMLQTLLGQVLEERLPNERSALLAWATARLNREKL